MKDLLIFPRNILSLGRIKKSMWFYVISSRPQNVTIENIDKPVIFQDIFYVFQDSFEIVNDHKAKKIISPHCAIYSVPLSEWKWIFPLINLLHFFKFLLRFFLTFASDNHLNLKRILWVIIGKQVNKYPRQFERLTVNRWPLSFISTFTCCSF